MTHKSCVLNITPSVLKKYFTHEYKCAVGKSLCLCSESSLTCMSSDSLLTTKVVHNGATQWGSYIRLAYISMHLKAVVSPASPHLSLTYITTCGQVKGRAVCRRKRELNTFYRDVLKRFYSHLYVLFIFT